MPTTRPHAQEPCLAVDVKVIEAAVWKRLEANSRRRIYRPRCRSPRSRWRGKRRAARQMRRVGRRWQRKRCQGRGTPQETLSIAKIGWSRMRIFGEIGTKCLFGMAFRQQLCFNVRSGSMKRWIKNNTWNASFDFSCQLLKNLPRPLDLSQPTQSPPSCPHTACTSGTELPGSCRAAQCCTPSASLR